MVSFYIVSYRLFLKIKGLPDAKVMLFTKKDIWFCSSFL